MTNLGRPTERAWIVYGAFWSSCILWWFFAQTGTIQDLVWPPPRVFVDYYSPSLQIAFVWVAGIAFAAAVGLASFLLRKVPDRGWSGVALLAFGVAGGILGWGTFKAIVGERSDPKGNWIVVGAFLALWAGRRLRELWANRPPGAHAP
jgi:hypothetical protein